LLQAGWVTALVYTLLVKKREKNNWHSQWVAASLGTKQSLHAGVVLAFAAATVKMSGTSVRHAPRAQLLC
jgi:hypothetical protein